MTLRNMSRDYQPVPDSPDHRDEKQEERARDRVRYALATGLNVLVFILSFCCLLLSIWFWKLGNSARHESLQDIISCKLPSPSCFSLDPVTNVSPVLAPANEAVELQAVRFDGVLNSTNIYKGAPNPELDSAWKDLYECKLHRVPILS